VGIGCPAAHLQADDPRLDHDPSHPRVRSTLSRHPPEPIGHGLAAADPGAPSLPRPLLSTAAPSVAAHLGELQRAAVRIGRCPHDLGYEGARIASTSAAIAYTAGSRAKVEVVVASHVRQIAPTN
jgi:hypothetical protein